MSAEALTETGHAETEIKQFLELFGEVSAFEVGLWAEALAPFSKDLRAAFVIWMRRSSGRPTPAQLVKIARELGRTDLTMRRIAEAVSDKFGLTLEELRSASRISTYVIPRHAAMSEMHDAGFSLPQIGRFFNRDHTSVLHGIRRHNERLAQQQEASNESQ